MMKSSTSFSFSSSLVFFFFIVASMAVYSEAAGDCLYRLIVQTGTVAEAGTDSSIGVTFGNKFGESVEVPYLMKWGKMPPGHEYFNSGNLDFFVVPAPCITIPVCKITVTSDGDGQKPRWYLEYVRVLIIRTNDLLFPRTETQFDFNQWLAIDEPPYKLTASRDVCEMSTINKSINDF